MEEFNYRGYPIKKLVELCDMKFVDRGKAPVLFGLPEQYSQGRIFREYARFPEDLPLNIYADHGIGIDVKAYPHEIENSAFAFFAFHEKKYENYRLHSSKPCYKVPPPMIWYRREHGIEQTENPQGTLFYAMHSTPNVEVFYDIEQICHILKSLPDEMQPVAVCLFMTDVHKGVYLKYLEQGIPVYTAGNVWDIRFVDRFYGLLRQFKYTASNHIGSYTYYSTELGIPFSFFKQETKLYNLSDKNFSQGVMQKHLLSDKVENLFKGIHLEITPAQQNYINYYVNMNNCISRKEMFDILKAGLKKISFV